MERVIPEGIDPDQGKVEVGSEPITHPLRKGRIRPTAFEISQTTNQEGRPITDWPLFKSVSGMDAGE